VDSLPSASRPSSARKRKADSTFCPECEYHFYLPARSATAILDADRLPRIGFRTSAPSIRSAQGPHRLRDRMQAERARRGCPDSAIVGKGTSAGERWSDGVTDFAFMAGSMGSVVGEKAHPRLREATRLKAAADLRSGSGGGARMQEGSSRSCRWPRSPRRWPLRPRRRLYISVSRTRPWEASAASFALQAEHHPRLAGALIGFAGQTHHLDTVRLERPKDFQTVNSPAAWLWNASYRERTCAPKSLASSTTLTIRSPCPRP